MYVPILQLVYEIDISIFQCTNEWIHTIKFWAGRIEIVPANIT